MTQNGIPFDVSAPQQAGEAKRDWRHDAVMGERLDPFGSSTLCQYCCKIGPRTHECGKK
jgi:hypothetical protein